jgi:hypothetical protein
MTKSSGPEEAAEAGNARRFRVAFDIKPAIKSNRG